MLGVGRDLCGSSSPTPLPKQCRLQQAAQDLVQAGLEYLQRRRLHSLPGQPVPVLRHPQSEEVLPHVQTDFPVLQFVPIAAFPAAPGRIPLLFIFLLHTGWTTDISVFRGLHWHSLQTLTPLGWGERKERRKRKKRLLAWMTLQLEKSST